MSAGTNALRGLADRGQYRGAWLERALLAWTLLLSWLYVALPEVRPVAVFFSRPSVLLAAVAAVALPALALRQAEMQHGRRVAVVALAFLLMGAATLMATGAQVLGALAATALILAAAYGYGADLASRLYPGEGPHE